MTSLRARPLFPLLLAVLVALALATGFSGSARAGGDDFEYGTELAAMGAKTGDEAYFEYARRVFNAVLESANASEEEKDLCRYGLAKITRDKAIGATGNMDIPYKEVLATFNDAIDTMEAFVNKNPEHEKAAEAQLQVGTTRLAFVQWARDNLLADAKYATQRNADPSQVQADAEKMVRGAIKYFDKLRQGHEAFLPEDASQEQRDDLAAKQVAQYYWVLCQYYLALVYETGSEEAGRALEAAAGHLDDFISLNDGQLLATYAQDIFGLTRWEQAKAATDEKEKEQFYRRAVDWFGTCVEVDIYGPQWEAVVANGYLHIGQCCRDAGRVGKTNFTKIGVNYLSDMERRFPTVSKKQVNCIRAMIEWAYLEFSQDHGAEAVEIAQRAGEYGKALGNGWLENLANGALKEFVGGSRGLAVDADADVLMRVADRFFAEKKWSEAIGAYQQVIGAVDRTEKNVEDFIIRSWERISSAYQQQGDLMAAALALEPIHEIWLDGLVKKVGGPDDPNMIRLGHVRRRAMGHWDALNETAGSSVYRREFTRIRDAFAQDYPEHPSSKATDWNAAIEKFGEAAEQMKAKDSRYTKTFRDALPLFRKVTQDNKSEKQDEAFTRLIYINYLIRDWPAMIKEANGAFTFWDSAVAKEQEKKFPTTAARRKVQKGRARVWLSEAFYQQEKWDDVLKALEGWRAEYGDVANSSGRVDFTSRALGHLTTAWVNKGEIEKANVFYRQLVKDNPGYSRLSKISFALAEHFNKQAREIDSERTEARSKLNSRKAKNGDIIPGARAQYRSVTVELGRAQGRLGDVINARRTAQRAVDLKKEKLEKGDEVTAELETQVKEALERIPELDAEIKSLTEKINRLKTEQETLQKQIAELTARIKKLAQELYEPLTKAASYYWDWDQALKEAGQVREAKNVAIFADLYYKAGLLRPEVAENHARAQSLYEDYLKMADAEEDLKREALARLGSIYSALARNAEPGSAEFKELIQKALSRLQGSLSKIPENNDLIVGLLKGDIAVIPWRPRDSRVLHRYPLPIPKDVAAFKSLVNAMGTASGPKMPVFKTAVENKRFEQDIEKFKNFVRGLPANQIERTVAGFQNAGSDMGFFAEHAESGDEFRLALAWIYSQSGDFDHMTKAYNLASSLAAGGRYGAEEDSEEWWAAQVIRLNALVTGAELQAKASPAAAPSPIVKEWTERASKMLVGLNTSSPGLGDDERPQTRGELQDILDRIQKLRDRNGLKPLNVNLVKLPDGGK